MSQSWSIIIFCFNEAGNLLPLVEKTQKVLAQIAPDRNELIIVNDGSTDNTAEIADSLEKKYGNISVIHQENKGIGGALITGYAAAKLENICAIPGDGQFDAEELLPYPNVPEGLLISFYRDSNLHYSVFRNYLSLFNKKFNEWFLSITLRDVNWIKIYKQKDLAQLEMIVKSSLIETEICSKLILQGIEIKEVPSKYMERIYGQSTGASFRIMMKAAREMFAVYRVIRNFKSRLKRSPAKEVQTVA